MTSPYQSLGILGSPGIQIFVSTGVIASFLNETVSTQGRMFSRALYDQVEPVAKSFDKTRALSKENGARTTIERDWLRRLGIAFKDGGVKFRKEVRKRIS